MLSRGSRARSDDMSDGKVNDQSANYLSGGLLGLELVASHDDDRRAGRGHGHGGHRDTRRGGDAIPGRRKRLHMGYRI